MDQDDLTGQSNVNNTLQYDPNVANFDYSSRMMPFNVNETISTGAVNTAQPDVISDSFNYNYSLPNGGFYTDASLPQPHIPLKPSEQQFCVDMNSTVHSENSYVNTSEPQLCIDITGNSTDPDITQEPNQYTLPNDVEMKNDFSHEEKHIMNDDYANGQLSMNPISHDVSASVNNEFSQINSHNELYYGDTSQEPVNIDHAITHEKPFVDAVQNFNEVAKPTILGPPIEIRDDVEENVKPEPSSEVEQKYKNEEIDLDTVQEQITTSAPVESSPNVVKDEEPVVQSSKVENESDSLSHPIANGVDKLNIEDELSVIQMCIRNGCANRAVNNPEWEQEFCSNECVIIHCKNVFTAWVKKNEVTLQLV